MFCVDELCEVFTCYLDHFYVVYVAWPHLSPALCALTNPSLSPAIPTFPPRCTTLASCAFGLQVSQGSAFSVNSVLMMLVLDVVLFGVLAAYCDRVGRGGEAEGRGERRGRGRGQLVGSGVRDVAGVRYDWRAV